MNYIDMTVKYFSTFTNNIVSFFSNGFVIAVIAAWFSVQLNTIIVNYKQYCEGLSARLVSLHKAIAIVLNNQDWISSYEMKSINLEQLLKLTKSIEFTDCHFTNDIDKIFYSIALNYNRGLVTYINTTIQYKKSKKSYGSDIINDISKISIQSFETLIEICERNLIYSKAMYINSLLGIKDKQQWHIQEKLKKFATDSRHKAMQIKTQEKSSNSKPEL